MGPVDIQVKSRLDRLLESIGEMLGADAVAVIGPIMPGLGTRFRTAIDAIDGKRDAVAVVLDTPGGVVEVVESMATALRREYGEVSVIVPDKAMSAGTLFALSADRILMDHMSCLGPLDPQVVNGGKLIPALPYLNQFERYKRKSAENRLTAAESVMAGKFDATEMFRFEREKSISIELLVKWLAACRFENWKVDGKSASLSEKKKRAEETAALLNDQSQWQSLSRPLSREVLRSEVGMEIGDLEENEPLFRCVREYFLLLTDYMSEADLASAIHSRKSFLTNGRDDSFADGRETTGENPRLDEDAVAGWENALGSLKMADVEIKQGADYSIEPALGGGVSRRRRNPGIDRAVVAAYEKAARELAEAGIEVKTGADYNIEPALGRGILPHHHTNCRKPE